MLEEESVKYMRRYEKGRKWGRIIYEWL
jgi:hypothetical protein